MKNQGGARINTHLLNRVKEIAKARGYTINYVLDNMILFYLDYYGEDIPMSMDYVPKVLKERLSNTENKTQ